ncbi:Cullin binding-domain-containing protein [Dunaliella salina]|uniref:Defective in cullin neddylation protein n=1 Tax=Dunaliella salina TaxID=3046 RepID=A0ABQ7G8A8_DUNSA|nr:Cullin binding-domain-containing protein [Dunaliella salina]|eukprot:KAF5830845.1 Cullin binding-domain-containing protein [Dunaliella salina]
MGNCETPDLLQLLSRSFSCYVASTDTTSWESSRQTSESLELLQGAGMHGQSGLRAIKELRPVIAWEYMMPDQFCKWYRFAFHLCKEPQRKHVQVNVAIEAWSLIMVGRFRLLDKWLDFVRQRKSTMRVISEDQWRQLLDFSRSVYEDLSNFDPNGAWACCLDEFVDHMRNTRSCLWDQATNSMLGFNGMDCLAPMCMAPVSPHCGSKRRPPDPVPVDPVCDQLNNIHLPHSPENPHGKPSSATPGPQPAVAQPTATPKRLCVEQLAFMPAVLPSPAPSPSSAAPAPLPTTSAAAQQLPQQAGATAAVHHTSHAGQQIHAVLLPPPAQGHQGSQQQQQQQLHSSLASICTRSPRHVPSHLLQLSNRQHLQHHHQQQQQAPLQHAPSLPSPLLQQQPGSQACSLLHQADMGGLASPLHHQPQGGCCMSLDLPVLHIPQRRHVKPRRATGVADLVQQSVSDVFGFGQGS